MPDTSRSVPPGRRQQRFVALTRIAVAGGARNIEAFAAGCITVYRGGHRPGWHRSREGHRLGDLLVGQYRGLRMHFHAVDVALVDSAPASAKGLHLALDVPGRQAGELGRIHLAVAHQLDAVTYHAGAQRLGCGHDLHRVARVGGAQRKSAGQRPRRPAWRLAAQNGRCRCGAYALPAASRIRRSMSAMARCAELMAPSCQPGW
jgi:hypothetical protein